MQISAPVSDKYAGTKCRSVGEDEVRDCGGKLQEERAGCATSQWRTRNQHQPPRIARSKAKLLLGAVNFVGSESIRPDTNVL